MSNDPHRQSTPDMLDELLHAYDSSGSSEEDMQSSEEEESDIFDLYAQRGTSISPSPSLSTDYGDESSEDRVTAAEYESEGNEMEDTPTPTTAVPKRTVHFKTTAEEVEPEDGPFLEEREHLHSEGAPLQPEHQPFWHTMPDRKSCEPCPVSQRYPLG